MSLTAHQNGTPRLTVATSAFASDEEGPDIVDHVAFEVQAGEVMGLVGESGSGKTTVALASARLCQTGNVDRGRLGIG